MTTKTCDNCKCELYINGMLNVGFPFGYYVELCLDCFQPFVRLMRAQGLMTDELEEKFSINREL